MTVWEVIGGGSSGGIVVRRGKDVKSPEEENRLSTGALVRETELDGERLHYQLIAGTGPQSGWVSTKFREKDLLVRSDKEPPAIIWEVIGGGSSGGILVRAAKDTSSDALQSRLGTGALVKQLELDGERLSYELLEGTGPTVGWVSLKLKDKDLLVKTEKMPVQDKAREFLKHLQNHEDASLHLWHEMLPQLGDDAPKVIEGLSECLKLTEQRTVRKALQALVALGNSSHIRDCLGTSQEDNVRADAARLLPDVVGDDSQAAGAEALRKALKDPSWLVRCWAARSLSRFPILLAEVARADLAEVAKADVEPISDVRVAATAALQHLDGKEAIECFDEPPCPASTPVKGRKLRVLAVHGAAANSKIMKMQVAGFKSALGKDTEWFFADSPLIWKPIPGSKDPLYSERSDGEKMLSGGEPFRWWYSHGNTKYYLVEDGIAGFRKNLAEHDPIDVVVAFSQGSNMMSIVVDAYRRENAPVPWTTTVMFSGGQVDDFLIHFRRKSSHAVVRSYNAANDDFHAGGEPSLDFMYSDILEFAHSDGHGFPKTQPRAKEIFTAMASEVRKRCGVD